jgi:hypothetical protein
LALPFSQLTGQASLAQLPSIASNTILGNNTGSTATPIALSVAQVNAILPVFTNLLNGSVPASGGGTTNFLRADGVWAVAGSGSVSSVSVASANGFAGTVATATTTPAITISTTVTGILYGNGTSIAAAIASNFPTLNQDTTGIAANITALSNSTLTTLSSLSLPYSQISGAPAAITQLTGEATGVGPGSTVVTLSNSAIIGKFLTGFASGPNSAILATDTILQAFQKIQAQVDAGGGGGVASVTASAPLASSGGANPNISIPQADGSTNGFLSQTDWSTFNNKQAALTFGSISTSTTGVSVGSGANSTVGPNVTVDIQTASSSQPGLLSSADWTTFNSKQAALGFTPENIANKGVANGYASLDASGLVPITQIPPAALERLVIVANQTARFALTTATVQNGDTVSQTDTGLMYFVIDDTNLNNSSGYSVYTAGTATSVPWSGITGIPSPVSALLGTNTGDITLGTPSGLGLSGQILSLGIASAGVTGALSGTDWSTFNNKQAALTFGNLTDAGTDGITITGGTGAVIGSGTSIAQHVADATHNGYLLAADWSTFNNKLDASRGNYITNPDAEVNTTGWNLYNDQGNPASAFVVAQDITFTAVASGSAGNGIDIDYIFHATQSYLTPLVTVVSSTHVTVAWYNGPTVANNPTATQLKAAWDAVPGAVALATAAITGVAGNLQYETGANITANGGDVAPVDGTGGVVTGVTFTRTLVNPIIGTASFDLGKDAANREGEGVSTDFIINSLDKGQTLQVSFAYDGSSGMVLGASSDVQVFVYDITNAVLIPVVPLRTLKGPVSTIKTFVGQFKASANSVNYRLILHIATTSATAWDLQLDNFLLNRVLNAVAATQVPSLVLLANPISGAVTDHMVVMWTDGAQQWVPATITGAAGSISGDPGVMLGFATNIVGSVADIYISGYMNGFSFGPFVGYEQYIDNTAGKISPLPSPFNDTYVGVGKSISSTELNIDFYKHVDAVGVKGGLLTNNVGGDSVLAVGANGNVLVANSAAADGLNWAAAVVTANPFTYTLATRTLTFQSQAANTFLAAPNGSAGAPTARLIVAADIPTLNQSTTGNAATATSATTATTATNIAGGLGGSIPYQTAVNTTALLANGTVGQILTSGGGTAAPTWTTVGGSGTVTSVAMSVPAFLSIAGSPITTSGTLAVTLSGTALPIANGGTAKTAVTIAATASSWAGWDANLNMSANRFISGFATTATAAGTTTLVVGSKAQQYFTGVTTQIVKLPTTSIVAGDTFTIVNSSTGVVTVQSSNASVIQAMASETELVATALVATPTTAANWSFVYSNLNAGLLNGAVASTDAVLIVNNGHIKSTQTTAPTASVNANAGTGATSTVANATDTAGVVNLTLGSIGTLSSGVQTTVNFNAAYGVAPIVVITPTNATTAQNVVIFGVYVTSTTAGFSINFASAGVATDVLQWNYHVIETQ